MDQFELRQRCEAIADELIDGFAGRGEAELMRDYAHPIPLLALASVFDYPAEETPTLLRDMIAMVDGTEDGVAAHARSLDGMRRLIERKHGHPGADVPSRLLAHPAGLTDDEIVQDLILVMTAAQRPVADWIGNSLRLMLTDDRFALSLSGGRRSVSEALNEVLWEDTPTHTLYSSDSGWDAGYSSTIALSSTQLITAVYDTSRRGVFTLKYNTTDVG